MLIDLHNHAFTAESSSSPEEAVEAAIRAGLDGIAFTEHNSFIAVEGARELGERHSGRILVFGGVEYDSREGHLLVFGLKDDSFLGLGLFAPASDMIRLASGQGAVVIAAHPFRSWGLFKAELSSIAGLAAVECCNGHNTGAENELASAAAARLGLPTTGGSDAHDKSDVGRCATLFFEPVESGGLAEALASWRYRGVCRY